jgi:hypothetical protein
MNHSKSNSKTVGRGILAFSWWDCIFLNSQSPDFQSFSQTGIRTCKLSYSKSYISSNFHWFIVIRIWGVGGPFLNILLHNGHDFLWVPSNILRARTRPVSW